MIVISSFDRFGIPVQAHDIMGVSVLYAFSSSIMQFSTWIDRPLLCA
jgi:hypothetical protein